MIHYICRDGREHTVAPFLCAARKSLRDLIRITPYEKIFAEGFITPGHLIFTDLDHLSNYEIEVAQKVATAVRNATPGIRVLNEPAHVLQRFSLLETLSNNGLNAFSAVRLDGFIPKLRYPVFIRREDGAFGPESELLYSEKDLRKAMQNLVTSGRPLKGRIAVEFCAEPSEDGFYRKYGAFCVGAHILPQHIQVSKGWVVKQETSLLTPTILAEEEGYLRDNPHEEQLRAIFNTANTDFGRIDYSFVHSRLMVYEINTNPAFPYNPDRNGREAVREAAGEKLIAALRSINTPIGRHRSVPFSLPVPVVHAVPVPRGPKSIWSLFGRSALLDWTMGIYKRRIPEVIRQKIPRKLKTPLEHILYFCINRT